MDVSPFQAEEVDPTGAGDSFLGGFVAGLVWGLTIPDAALLGNFFGSLTVTQVGVPKFNDRMLQVWFFCVFSGSSLLRYQLLLHAAGLN